MLYLAMIYNICLLYDNVVTFYTYDVLDVSLYDWLGGDKENKIIIIIIINDTLCICQDCCTQIN
jgi:hypothetical protein